MGWRASSLLNLDHLTWPFRANVRGCAQAAQGTGSPPTPSTAPPVANIPERLRQCRSAPELRQLLGGPGVGGDLWVVLLPNNMSRASDPAEPRFSRRIPVARPTPPLPLEVPQLIVDLPSLGFPICWPNPAGRPGSSLLVGGESFPHLLKVPLVLLNSSQSRAPFRLASCSLSSWYLWRR